MEKKWCHTCHKNVKPTVFALRKHREKAAGIGVPCKFMLGKPGRPKKDPKVVKKNKKEIWKKHAAIKRGAKYNIEPESLEISPEPPIDRIDQTPIGQAKNHKINYL